MRKHGWQLPYHPLQVVAVAVFLALGFAFYVFFAPFVGKQLFQYIIMGIYTPLIICSFGLYIWCAASDPADPGVFKSKKYIKNLNSKKHAKPSDSKHGGESTQSVVDANGASIEEANDNRRVDTESAADQNTEPKKKNSSDHTSACTMGMLALLPCAWFCNLHKEPSDCQSEDGMFYCSLCEVEVFKYSKHCRVCDKCVDHFDHHCRWLNNCVGKRNYRKFFTLMVSALLLLILQWSTGILVLILCFLKKKQISTDISSKLGSSFTVAPFVIVVAMCTILSMIATLPLAQLFFFHILLIKKGISTYDYIIALREQEQQGGGGQQSPQMSPASSLTGMSSASSFSTFHRAAWCTPPRLFVEDQYDVVPPDNGSVSSHGKRTTVEEQTKKNPAAVKISPWALARLNAEDVSKAAAEARKKSKILRPVTRPESSFPLATDSTFGSSGQRMALRPDNNRKRGSKHISLPTNMPIQPLSELQDLDAQNSRDHGMISKTSTSLGPLQLEARNDYRMGRAIPRSVDNIVSSPESSLDSPEIHPFRVSSSGHDEGRRLTGLSASAIGTQRDNPLSRSTSDGYDASGGEDSDRVTTRIQHRPDNWSSLPFGHEPERSASKFRPPSSATYSNHRKL